MDRIFLIGYMGSGKTTIGQILAQKLGYTFLDMDSYIEGKMFKSVSQIFADLGEEHFRLLEQKSLHEIAEIENVVIATGGGAPCFFDNMEYMNRNGITVYLKLSPKELTERLETFRTNKRPLLGNRKGEELQQFVSEGLAKREFYYLQSAHCVSGEIESTVSQICTLLARRTDQN